MAEEGLTTTGIDALVDYLNKHGEMEESRLAEELKVSEKVIEDWASVLEKASIVKITYKIGKMFVAPLSVTNVDVASYKNALEMKKQSVETELMAQMNVLQEFDRRIANLSKIAASADASFKKNSGQVKKDLDELERIGREVEKHYGSIKMEKDRVDKISSTLDTEMHALEEMAGKIQNFSTGQSDVKGVVADIKEKMKRYDEAVRSLDQEFDKIMVEKRAQLRQMHDGIYSEMKSLEEAVQRQANQLGENEKLEKYAKKESARLSHDAQKDKTAIENNISSVKQGIDRLYPLAESKVKSITERVAGLKKDFGEVANINEQLGALNARLGEIRKEQESMMKETTLLKGELKSVELLKGSDVEKSVQTEQIEKKVFKLGGKAKELDNKMKKAKEDLDSVSGAPAEEV
ncbi:MAG: hypothetical protein KGH59_03630 [Candidatus Micrarchaeota archaeon]|nr:hypothetical protein [Candidatus Micrarchaeota archaeon]MDE1804847.1 hypothetical protein [Candidatus Micrarchaeota archaeon]